MSTLVFSYSHADEALRNTLETHLSPLKRQGLIEAWHDRRIIAGEEFVGQINQHFANADVVLLLVSPDFINSDYCFNVEMAQAVERHNRGEATVIPVILRPCHWHDLPFGKLLAATPDGKPVTQYPTLDEGFYLVVDAIKKALKALIQGQVEPIRSAAVPLTAMPAAEAARSSNLRVKKTFTDRDRDIARTECFAFVGKYFANSLDELKKRNPELDVAFRQIDANSFEATVYVDGGRSCFCGIWLAAQAFGGDIVFSYSGVTGNSFNESFSMANDGYTLGFKALGFSSFGRDDKAQLGNEGVAEYLWEMFIRPLQ